MYSLCAVSVDLQQSYDVGDDDYGYSRKLLRSCAAQFSRNYVVVSKMGVVSAHFCTNFGNKSAQFSSLLSSIFWQKNPDDDDDNDASNLYASVSPVGDKNVSGSVDGDARRTVELAVAFTIRTKTEPQLTVFRSENLQRRLKIAISIFQYFNFYVLNTKLQRQKLLGLL